MRILRLFGLACFSLIACYGQAVRFDSDSFTTSNTCTSGKLCPVQAIPGATVNVCSGSQTSLAGCLAALATTYTSASSGTPCSTTSQLTPIIGGACTGVSDNQGNFGFWLLPGSYSYYVRVPATAGGGTFGPYQISVGASAGCPLGFATCDANYATLPLACAAAGSGSLYISRDWTITASLTCSNAVFIAPGKTVTISGAAFSFSMPSNSILTCYEGGGLKNSSPHGSVLTLNGASNVIVSGCKLVAANNAPAQPTALTDGNAVYVYGGSSAVTLSGNLIQGYENCGVCINNASGLKILDNTFSGGTNSTAFTAWNFPAHSIISYGTMNNSVTITGNTFTSANDVCIGLEPSATNSSTNNYNIISQNYCANANAYGIVLYARVGNSGQIVSHNQINNNIIKDITARVGSGGIVGQHGAGMCIYLADADDTDVTGNYLENCLIGRNDTTLPLGAISASSLNGDALSKIVNNRVVASNYDGIHVVNNNTNAKIGTLVAENRIETVTHIGIFVQKSASTQILQNTIQSAGDEGINVDVNSPRVQISSNVVRLSGDYGMYLLGANPSVIGNTAELNGGTGFGIFGNNAIITGNISRNNSQSPSNTTYGFILGGTSGLTLSNNIAVDDQGGGSTQRYGYFENSSYADSMSVTGNGGSGNRVSLWSIGNSIYTAHGNVGLGDQSRMGGTITTNGTAIGHGTCQSQPTLTITNATGPGGGSGTPIVSYPAGLPSASWIGSVSGGITLWPVMSGNVVTLWMCNTSPTDLTPTSLVMNVNVVNRTN